jgi:DNA-binding phage protein
MALTKNFKDLVKSRVERDPEFRVALLQEAIQAMLSGDVDLGKAVLRDYINATVGFEKLGKATGTPPKSLMRMFGPGGNPRTDNLFSVISHLQKQAHLKLQVIAGKQ